MVSRLALRMAPILLIAGGALAVLGGVPVAGSTPPAPAAYEAVAAADVLRVAASIPGAPVSDAIVDLSSASAQAVVNGLGTSNAYAAAPYPGAATTLPDTVRATGGPPLPSYPFIASSQHPASPESKVTQPGVNLEANSAPTTSSARAVTGADGGEAGAAGRGMATAGAALQDTTVVAEAAAETSGLVVGPVALGRVTSRARVSRGGGGEPNREQSLEVGGLTIAGQGVGIGRGGLLVGGTAIPLPDTHPARAALAQAGIGIRYLEATDTPDGVVAPGLLITQTIPASLTGSPSSVTYTIGRAGVAVQAAAGTEIVPDPLLEPSAPESTGGAVAIDAAPVPQQASAGTAPAFDDGRSSPAPASPTFEPDGGAAAGTAPPGPSLSPPTGTGLPAAAARARHGPAVEAWSDRVYAALAVPGVLVLGAFFVIRVMGVKSIWVS